MIAAGGLDAVVIAAPDDVHREMVLAAADAGLHILCEKPLANTLADAVEMQRRVEAAGVTNMVLFTWRWQPHWRYVKHLVDTGYRRPLLPGALCLHRRDRLQQGLQVALRRAAWRAASPATSART